MGGIEDISYTEETTSEEPIPILLLTEPGSSTTIERCSSSTTATTTLTTESTRGTRPPRPTTYQPPLWTSAVYETTTTTPYTYPTGTTTPTVTYPTGTPVTTVPTYIHIHTYRHTH